jgi:hypothetical protein
MITIEKMRERLNIPRLTDEEIVKICNFTYETMCELLDDMYENGEIPKNGSYKDGDIKRDNANL